jgi:putative transposase
VTERERQSELQLPIRGGRRPGAGRKPKGDAPLRPHSTRPALSRRHPVHVTIRMRPHVWSLRSQRGMSVVESALLGAGGRSDFRVTHLSVQGNHVHLVVEAGSARALTGGMKALAIRLAKGMNRHVLRTPAEVRRALAYVAGNFASHARRRGEEIPGGVADRFGSEARPDLVAPPASWLLRLEGASAGSSDGR